MGGIEFKAFVNTIQLLETHIFKGQANADIMIIRIGIWPVKYYKSYVFILLRNEEGGNKRKHHISAK